MSDILPFSQWSEINSTETDPVKQLKNFSDYVRQESWKNGTYNQAVEDELKSGIDQKLIEGGLLTETTTDEEKAAIRDSFTATPKSNLDVDARFVYDDMIKTGVDETHPLPTGDREILSSYVASRNLAERNKDPVMAAQADSYAEAVGGILANREIVNRAKKNALARGELSAVAIEDNDGNRYVEVGPDADQEVIRKETESLIKRGALAAEDIPNLSLNFQDNGFGSTNANTRRSRGFVDDLNTIVKNDKYLSDLINKEASSLAFREKEAQESVGESILGGVEDFVGGAISTIGGLVTEKNLSGAESAIKETMTRSADYRDELVSALKNNTALADSYSDSEIDRFADDYIKALKGPTYRADKAGSGISTLSTGAPIIARELALRPAALESEMEAAGLTEAQRDFARKQRETLAESSVKGTTEFLSRMDDEFVDKLAKSREVGISDRQFVEEWLADENNYNNFTNRAKSLGMETVKAIGTLAVSVPALLGNEDAAKAMVDMSKAGQDYSQYAEIFGDRFGVGQQLANIVPSVAVDLLASAGTGAIYTGVKSAATAAAKNVAKNVAVKYAASSAAKLVPQALGSAISKIDEVAAIAARGVATETPSAVFKAVSNGIEKGLVGAGRFTDNMMSVGPATFLRSAGSTYASVYDQLPEDMTHEAKHEASIGYAVTAGLFTAALTAGMSSIGLGGTESLVTKNLDDLTFSQMRRLFSQTRRASANVTDDMIKKVVRQQTAGAFKSLVRDHAEGFVSEGFEEGVDQAFQILVEEAAMKKDTPIREIGKGVMDAFVLGGLMGAGTTAIRNVTPTITADGKAQEAAKMERARTELYSGIAKKLTDANSPKTAEALAKAFADADAVAAAATTTQPDGTPDIIDPANLDTDNMFEKWNPADETTGLMADFIGRKVHYAGQQGILKSDGKGGVYLEYTERKSTEQPSGKSNRTKTKTKTSTDAKAKGTKVRIDLGSSAQLAKGIIETPYTALRTKVDIGNVKAGSLVVKSGKVYYALPHIDDVTTPPYIVRNNKGEPVGLGFTNVTMVGSNATRDNFMVSFDGPIYDAAKYYGIDFSELSTITQADNSASEPRQTKEDRKKKKEEAKAFRAILVEPDPETQLSPLDVLISNYEGLDILADPELDIETIPLPELINLSESLDDVLNDTELDPELKKQLASIHEQVKIARAETEGFVAIANSEYTPINGDESIEIVDNLPRDFKITDYGLIKINYEGEEVLVKPVSINKQTYKITVVIDGKRKSLPIAGTVDKNTFNEVMPEIKARAASQSNYSLPNLRRMSLEDLADVADIIDELRQSNINNAPVLVRLKKLQKNVDRVVEQKEAQAKKQAEKEAAAAAKAAKASETKAAKTTKKEGKKAKAAEPEAEKQEPEKPKRTRKKATAAEKEEVLKNIAEDVEDDVDEDVEAEPEDVEAEVEETPSGPLTDEEFAELTALGVMETMRGLINNVISEQPDFRTAIIEAASALAKTPQKANGPAPLNLMKLRAAVKAIVENPSNKNKTKSKPKKAEKDPSVVSVEEESTEPEDETTPVKPTAKKQVVGAVIKVGSGDNYQTPRYVLESLSKKNNLLNPLDIQSRDQVDMALVYAASLDKKGTVTLDKISAGNLPDVIKTPKINRDKAAASNAPIVLIKDGRGFKPHPDSINLARIQNAKKSGEDVQVLIISKGTAKNNGEVRIDNKIAKNKTVANKGRVLTEALNDVLYALDKKYPDGNGKPITLREFIERMDRYTAKFEETEYNSKHRQAYEAAIEQASKDINVAAKKLQADKREESGEFLAARERIRQAAEILTREIKPKTERVVSNVKYNTPELRPVFRSDQEKEEFDRMVEHGYPERDMGPFLGKERTGLTGVAHPAEPKTYLTGKSIYLLEKIREMYPVLDWEGINAKSRAKTKPYSILRLSKKIQYRKNPNEEKPSQVPVVVDKNGSAVFTNDPLITAVQLSELGPVEIPDSMLKTRNPSIQISVLDGITYAVGVTDYNGSNVQDTAKQTGNVRLARLEKGTALMTAIGGVDALSRVGGSGVVRLLSVPNKRTKPQDIGEYFAQVTSYFENRIGKGKELTDVAEKIVNDSIVQLVVETTELTIAHQLARKVAMSKQFSSRINEEVTEAQIDETPLTIFTRFSDLTTEDIETAITPDDVMKILSPKTRAPKVRTLTTNQNKFVRAYEATRDEANKLDSSLLSITGKKEIAKAKKEVAELRKYLLDKEAQYNKLLRDRDYLDRQNTIARQQFEANQQSATGSEISKADLAVMIEDYYPAVTADNRSNLLRGEARHNYVLKKFGVMMVRRMSDPSFATGPKPDKIIDSIASRYRASFAKSQTGVTNVSIETLLTTSKGGWSLNEANPEAGVVLDGVMSELEAIEDVMTSSASETLRGMLIHTANNSPELKAQLVIFGQKLDRGLFSRISTENESEEIIDILGVVMSSPDNQAVVINRLKGLPRNPEGRKMLAILSMMGWAPDPMSVTGINVPTAEEIENASDLNLDGDLREATRREIADRQAKMREDNKRISEDSEAYAIAMKEALASKEGDEIRDLFARQDAYDRELKLLGDARFLAAQFTISEDEGKNEEREARVRNNRNAVKAKITQINNNLSLLETRIAKSKAFISGVSSESEVFDPAPRIEIVRDLLRQADEAYDAIVVPPPVEPKDKIFVSNYENRKSDRDDLEESLKLAKNIKRLKRNGNYDSEVARLGDLNSYVEDNKAEFDEKSEKLRVYNDLFSQKSKAKENRENISKELESLKQLAASQQLQEKLAEANNLRKRLSQLEQQKVELEKKLEGDLSDQVFKDLRDSPENKQYLEAIAKLPKAEEAVTRAQKSVDKLRQKSASSLRQKLTDKGLDGNALLDDLAKMEENLRLATQRRDQLANSKFLDAAAKLPQAEKDVAKAQRSVNKLRKELIDKGLQDDALFSSLFKKEETLRSAIQRRDNLLNSISGRAKLSELNEDARVVVERNLKGVDSEITFIQDELAKLSGATSKKVESARRIVASLEAQRDSLLRSRKSFSELVEWSQDLKNPNNRKLIKAILKNIQERINQYSSLNSNASARVNQIVTDGFMVAAGKITNPNQIRSQASVVTQRNTLRETNPTIRRATEAAKTTDQLLTDAQSKQRQAAVRLRNAQDNATRIATAIEDLEAQRDAQLQQKQGATRKKDTKSTLLRINTAIESLETQRDAARATEASAKEEFDSSSAEVTRLHRLKAAAKAASRPLMSMSADDLVKSSVSKLANEAEIRELGLTESPIAALEKIAKSGPPHLRLLAKMVLRNKDAIDGLTVVIARFDHRIAGFQTGNYVVINLDGHNGNGVADVLVHEVVHFLTRDILSDPEVAARVDELRDLAASRLIDIGEDVSDYLYALSSNEEFLSAIFTDQKLQEALDVTESGNERSLFQKIIDFILRVFKADNMQTKTAMRELIKLTQESIDDRVYGSRAADLRDARTVRLDRQTNERARGFIDRLLAQEDALFATGEDAAMDADYLAAVEAGDMETAQRMVDEAAKAAGYDTKAWHGTIDNFDTFDMSRGRVMFYTKKDLAEATAFGRASKAGDGSRASVMGVFLNTGKKFFGGRFTEKSEIGDSDSVITDNNVVVIFDPSRIKSADPITYDANGNVIPLSQRFNPQSNNILFSPSVTRDTRPLSRNIYGPPIRLRMKQGLPPRLQESIGDTLSYGKPVSFKDAGKALRPFMTQKQVALLDFLSEKVTGVDVTLMNYIDRFDGASREMVARSGKRSVPAGEWNESSSAIRLYLDTSGMNPEQHFARVYLHELVHAATTKAMRGDSKLVDEVRTLMNYVESQDPSITKAYGMLNAFEFVAESLTNSKFQAQLSSIPSQRVGRFTLLDEFIDWVKRILGVKNRGTALEDALEVALLVTGNIDSLRPLDRNTIPKGLEVVVTKIGNTESVTTKKFAKKSPARKIEKADYEKPSGMTFSQAMLARAKADPRIRDLKFSDGSPVVPIFVADSNLGWRMETYEEALSRVKQVSNRYAILTDEEIRQNITDTEDGDFFFTNDNDLETRIRSQVPAGMTLVADTKLLGAMGVSDTGIIYYNPDLVAASVDGYDTEIADQMIGVMVTHEVAHAAANAVMTPQDYDDIATELGREELDRIADKYYSLTYPNVADRAAAMEEDRQNGDLDDRRIAAEFVRMEIEKAIVGSSSEDLLNRFVNKPSIVARIVEAIRGFINSMTRRQDRDFSLKIAADISRASRVMEELLNGGSLPASPEPHPTFGHAGELVDAATNGSHQMLYTMRIEEADKANKTASSIFSRLSKMASALPREIDKFIKKREAELNANRLLLDRFAPQYRYYLEKALKNGANIDDVAKMFGSTSPTLDEATEAKISTQVENFRNSISNDDKGKSAKVRQFRERATLNAVKKNATAFRNEQNAAEARLNAISPEFVTLIKRFRAEIDKRQMAIGYDDESKGVYLTRTYKFFNTKGWAAAARNGGKYKVNGEVVDFDALREQASKIFEGQVRAEYSKEGKSLTNDTLRSEVFKRMDNLLATLETEAKKDKGESISQDTTRSLTKGPLDPALRQLLGETVNPFENAIRTFGYVSMLDVNKQALTSIRDALITTGYGVETEREGYVQVFGKGKSEALAPLAGLYVREDIAKELEAEFAGSAARLLNHNEKVMQQFGRGLAKMSGLSMTAKTLMGVGFFTRNAVTNQLILPLAQGIIPNPVHAARSYKLSFLANFESRGRNASEEDIQEMMHLTRLGLMRDSSQRGTFDDLLRGFADRTGTTYESVVDNIVKAAQEADYKSLMGIAEQLKRYAGKGIDVLASLNGLMDDASKVQVFYFERAELKAAYPDMTDAELDEKASDKAKATMPGHIEQLDLVKKFNRSPFALLIFAFARWKTEVLRTLINTYKIGYSEIRSGNPRMMVRGARRLAGNSTVVLSGAGIGGSLLATIFSKLIDDEDEEKKGKSDNVDDEKVKAALRLALPAWQRGHTVSMSTNGRELRVVDMTAMMPYSTVSDSINIIKEGLRTGKGIDARGIADYWASQFVGSQIAAGALADIFRNKDDFDKKIYEESDTITAASVKVLNHIYSQAYEPSVVKKARQITREGEQEREAIIYGELLGARPVSYTLDRVASSGFYNLKDQIDSAKRLRAPLSSGRFISDEDFVNTMTEAQEYEDRVQSQMFQFTQALTTLGYDDRSIVLSATNTGSSKKRVKDAMSGINTAWSGGPDWRKTMTFNVEKGGEDDPDRRYELLRSTFESMPPMVDVTGQ